MLHEAGVLGAQVGQHGIPAGLVQGCILALQLSVPHLPAQELVQAGLVLHEVTLQQDQIIVCSYNLASEDWSTV